MPDRSGQIYQADVEDLLAGLDAESESLLSSLGAGGLGASSRAEILFQTARSIEGAVDWGNPAELNGEGALQTDDSLAVSLVEHTLLFTEQPRSLTLCRVEPNQRSLSMCWTEEGSLSIEYADDDREDSWTVMSDGSCLNGDDFDLALQNKIDALQAPELASSRGQPEHAAERGGMAGWLGDMADDFLPGLAAAATVAATAAATVAVKKAVKKAVEPPTPEKAEAKEKEICAECGAELVEAANFCAQCGAPVVREVVCSCGRTFGENENFCPQCGEKRP